jgi:hypothetical protein
MKGQLRKERAEVDEPLARPIPAGWFGYSSLIESVLRHGISWAHYNRLLAEQDGACAICRLHAATVGPLVIDHDHHSGAVRGLLCHSCNLVLGHAEDDPYRLKAAMEYLFERGCEATAPPTPEEAERLETMRRKGIITEPRYPEERKLHERDKVRKGLKPPA